MATNDKRGQRKPPEKVEQSERTKSRHKHPHIGFNLEQGLLDLVDDEAGENDRTRAAQLKYIVKAYYRDKGLWPPSSDKGK